MSRNIRAFVEEVGLLAFCTQTKINYKVFQSKFTICFTPLKSNFSSHREFALRVKITDA